MTTRLLIVSPAFHGYHKAVARAFAALDFEAETYCYDTARSDVEKAWRKIRHELPAQLRGGNAHLSPAVVTQRASEAVLASRPDVVLVIRGDVLGQQFWEAATSAGRPVVVWMYDEMRRTEFDPDLVSGYAQIATYSRLDALALQERGISAVHVPLGFDHTQPVSSVTDASGVISFIGAEFERRRTALQHLYGAGLPVRAWGRSWSDHPVDRARTWRLRSIGIPNGRDVPAAEALGIMRESAATLNIHGDQDGFTMRTFEAAGVGAVQLIDRRDVEPFYVPDEEVLVYDGLEHLKELVQQVLRASQDFDGLRRKAVARTLNEHTLVHRAQALKNLW